MGRLISKIVPELEHIAVAVEELHEDPENIRVHDDRSVEAIAESFNEFGQRKPIVALDNGKVIAGNAGLAAARDLLGWSHVAVVRFRDDEEENAIRFAIADNRTAELSWFDEALLREAVKKLASVNQENTIALGFTKGDRPTDIWARRRPVDSRTNHPRIESNGTERRSTGPRE